MNVVAAVLSLIVPGLGQLVRGRIVEGVLFLLTVSYIRLMLAGLAGSEVEGGRLSGFLWGAFGVPKGTGNPTFVVFTVLTVALHALATWHAYRSNEQVRVRSADVQQP